MQLFGYDIFVGRFTRTAGAPIFEARQGNTADDYEIHLGKWWVVVSKLGA